MWLDKDVSIYTCMANNTGELRSYRNILFTQFAVEHEWYYRDYDSNKWVTGVSNDLNTMIRLRTHTQSKENKTFLKSTLQCYTPAAALKSKKKGSIEELHRNGILQFDFDYDSIKDYDIEELKRAVFSLAFIGFCGLSCSGKGFYALALIAEPEKQTQYAEHCFKIFEGYGIPVDTSKGRNVNDLRFVSYDANMLIREQPEPLRIRKFYVPRVNNTKIYTRNYSIPNSDRFLKKGIEELLLAQPGNRIITVRKVAYMFGGKQVHSFLDEIKSVINSSSVFDDERQKYLECAEDCFKSGWNKPF